jgi:hypothetical protein
MNKNKYDEIIDRLLKSEEIKKLYDEYIIKDITFKEWVIGHVDSILSKDILISKKCHKK